MPGPAIQAELYAGSRRTQGMAPPPTGASGRSALRYSLGASGREPRPYRKRPQFPIPSNASSPYAVPHLKLVGLVRFGRAPSMASRTINAAARQAHTNPVFMVAPGGRAVALGRSGGQYAAPGKVRQVSGLAASSRTEACGLGVPAIRGGRESHCKFILPTAFLGGRTAAVCLIAFEDAAPTMPGRKQKTGVSSFFRRLFRVGRAAAGDRGHGAGGGCSPTARKARRRFTRAGAFRCRAATVARPVAVRPSISKKPVPQAKCRDQRCRRGLNR